MTNPSEPGSDPADRPVPPAANAPWWAPGGDGAPPTAQPASAPPTSAPPTGWRPEAAAGQPVEPAAAPGRRARLTAASRRPRVRVGAAILAAVIVGAGAGGAVTATAFGHTGRTADATPDVDHRGGPGNSSDGDSPPGTFPGRRNGAGGR